MTEAEWLACDDPRPMLEFLRGKASDRKLRLFACACVRPAAAAALPDPCLAALEAAERFADGLAGHQDLDAARADAIDRRLSGRVLVHALFDTFAAALHLVSPDFSDPRPAGLVAAHAAKFAGTRRQQCHALSGRYRQPVPPRRLRPRLGDA